jgi:serine/threonine-protein kinase ATR
MLTWPDVLLNYVQGMHTIPQTITKVLPFAAEAAWATGRWSTLEKYISLAAGGLTSNFNLGVGQSLLALQKKDGEQFSASIRSLREQITRTFSSATTSSLNICHENIFRLHVLTELEMIAGTDDKPPIERAHIIESLNRRLEVIGSYLSDKQYLLGVRRAAMQLSRLVQYYRPYSPHGN